MNKSPLVKSGYIGPPLDQQLIEDLRHQAKAGTTVLNLVDTIQARILHAQDGSAWNILYLIHAFHLGIKEVKDLDVWNRFTSNGYTDEQINATLMPLIRLLAKVERMML